jgi:hypothetical protein
MNAIRPPHQTSPSGFSCLPLGGQISLWAVRLWVNAESASPELHRTVRTGFLLIGLPRAYEALNAFLTLVTHGDRSVFCTCRCNEPSVSSDERRFLACLAALQRGAVVVAFRDLLRWIGSAEIRPAMAASLDYAQLLSTKNLKAMNDGTPHTLATETANSACGCGDPSCGGRDEQEGKTR